MQGLIEKCSPEVQQRVHCKGALLFLHECLKGNELAVEVCDEILTILKDTLHNPNSITSSYSIDSWCIYGRVIWSLSHRNDWSETLEYSFLMIIISSYFIHKYTFKGLCFNNLLLQNFSSILTSHGRRCSVCSEPFSKSIISTMSCAFCGLRLHSPCAIHTGILTEIVTNEGRITLCQDCSRTDLPSLRLTILRNLRCVNEVSPWVGFEASLTSLEVLSMIGFLSRHDLNECNTAIVNLLSSLLMKSYDIVMNLHGDF